MNTHDTDKTNQVRLKIRKIKQRYLVGREEKKTFCILTFPYLVTKRKLALGDKIQLLSKYEKYFQHSGLAEPK